jgi:hypothetical protein
MLLSSYTFKNTVWVYEAPSPWYFINLPCDISAEIKDQSKGLSAGFGSLKVSVKIGQTNWKTSIFPNNKERCYMLPIKKQVRDKENITDGDQVQVEIKILF